MMRGEGRCRYPYLMMVRRDENVKVCGFCWGGGGGVVYVVSVRVL